jgi:phosphate transport system ATP-binding protein
LTARDINFFYGQFQALHDISLDIPANKVTAFIGPSGCGKSTFLRTMNRMNETIRNTRVEGELKLDNENLLEMDVTFVRRRVGMVFQKSNPFPKTIFDNVAYGLRVNGIKKRSVVSEAVERA